MNLTFFVNTWVSWSLRNLHRGLFVCRIVSPFLDPDESSANKIPKHPDESSANKIPKNPDESSANKIPHSKTSDKSSGKSSVPANKIPHSDPIDGAGFVDSI